MFAAGWAEILHPHLAAALVFECLDDLRQGEMVGRKALRKPAEIADRLEMNTAHGRLPVKAEANNLPDLFGVDPPHQGRHEDDAQSGRGQMVDGPAFFGEQRPAAQGLVKTWSSSPSNWRKTEDSPGVAQPPGQFRIVGELQAVAVELDKGETGLWPARTISGRSARTVGSPPESWRLQPPVWAMILANIRARTCLIGIGRLQPPLLGKTDRAAEIAAGGDLDQGGAGALTMAYAEAAVKGATLVGSQATAARIGQLRAVPGGKSRISPPDCCRKSAMFRTVFLHPHVVAVLRQSAGQAPQTLRADACHLSQVFSHGRESPAGSKPFSTRMVMAWP